MKNPLSGLRKLYARLTLLIAMGNSPRIHRARQTLYGRFTADDVNTLNDRENLVWIIDYHPHLDVKLAAVRRLALVDQVWIKYLTVHHTIDAVCVEAVANCYDHRHKISLALGSHSEAIRAAAVHDLYGGHLEAVARSPFEDVRLAYLTKLGVYAPCISLMAQHDESKKVRKLARQLLSENQVKRRKESIVLTSSTLPPKNRPN